MHARAALPPLPRGVPVSPCCAKKPLTASSAVASWEWGGGVTGARRAAPPWPRAQQVTSQAAGAESRSTHWGDERIRLRLGQVLAEAG